MESLKIILTCIAAAILYGIIHDQITARVCVEYFTVFHPPVFPTDSPTLLAFGWGVIATWWVGAFLGLFLAVSARSGSRPQLTHRELLKPIGVLLVVMAISAFFAGLLGYFWGEVPPYMADAMKPDLRRRFLADWWAHSASYLTGFLGGIVLCILTYRRRRTILTKHNEAATA